MILGIALEHFVENIQVLVCVFRAKLLARRLLERVVKNFQQHYHYLAFIERAIRFDVILLQPHSKHTIVEFGALVSPQLFRLTLRLDTFGTPR